jgi:hypothetical protein
MINLFTLSFKRVIPLEHNTVSNELILNIFEKGLRESYCDKITVIEPNKLSIANEDFRIKPDLNWNIWYGINKAEIIITRTQQNKTTIKYKLYYTKAFIFFILISFFAGVFSSEINSDVKGKVIAIGSTVLIILLLFVVSLSILLIGHRNLINDCMQQVKNASMQS